jgi:alkylation response protein AidB-like acyl-CoA dehydrogenase
MLAGDIEMCIAYSEPGAGNDLAAAGTTAAPDGQGWLLEGTKTLITGADKADFCLTVAVTDPGAPVSRRFSMFVVDMRAPGVSITARPTMAGYALWDVGFRRVRLESGALIGQEGGGWRQLARAVEEERNGMFSLGWCQRLFDELVDFCANTDDPLIADTLAGSLAKVHLTELAQRLAQAATEIAGLAGGIEGSLFGEPVPYAAAGGRFAFEYLFRVDGPISVGANELHRTGIAQAGLGLPRG